MAVCIRRGWARLVAASGGVRVTDRSVAGVKIPEMWSVLGGDWSFNLTFDIR